MPSAKSLSKGPRLGTRMRGDLSEAYDKRGNLKATLGILYSPKAQKAVVINSRLEFGHVLLVESDPDIQQVDYAPQKRITRLHGEVIGTIPDAEVVKRSGVVVFREIKPRAELELGEQSRANRQILAQAKAAGLLHSEHEVLTEDEIFAQPQRIHNWAQILPWISQCQTLSLDRPRKGVLELMRKRKEISFRDLKEHAGANEYPLMAAGLFNLVQFGLVHSDLDTKPFTLRSRFFVAQE